MPIIEHLQSLRQTEFIHPSGVDLSLLKTKIDTDPEPTFEAKLDRSVKGYGIKVRVKNLKREKGVTYSLTCIVPVEQGDQRLLTLTKNNFKPQKDGSLTMRMTIQNESEANQPRKPLIFREGRIIVSVEGPQGEVFCQEIEGPLTKPPVQVEVVTSVFEEFTEYPVLAPAKIEAFKEELATYGFSDEDIGRICLAFLHAFDTNALPANRRQRDSKVGKVFPESPALKKAHEVKRRYALQMSLLGVKEIKVQKSGDEYILLMPLQAGKRTPEINKLDGIPVVFQQHQSA